MKKIYILLVVLTLVAGGVESVLAEGYPWRDHAAPYDYTFENHIDTHQQSMITGNGQLQGFFYIRFTGSLTPEGYPEAVHGSDTVGWILRGVPVDATLVSLSPEPIWCISADDIPRQPGFTHFHWIGPPEDASGLSIGGVYSGFLMKLTARDTFFFMEHEGHGAILVTPGIDYVSHANITVGECN